MKSDRDLTHLMRYFVVNCRDEPTANYPVKGRHRAEAECRRLNGAVTDSVLGIKGGRPYRVVPLVPMEGPHV